jgi:hypothetical protein
LTLPPDVIKLYAEHNDLLKGGNEMESQIDVTSALKPRGVKERFAMPVQTLANDRHLGRGIPYIKCGKSIYYLISDIEKYLQSKRIDPNK